MSNIETAYEFFINSGFTPAQSAGIVGNLQQESGVNPESVQQGGPGRGIAQWSAGGRWQPSLMTGNPSTDLPNQEQYILDELQQNPAYGLAALKQSTSPIQAAQVFGTDFERYGIAGGRVADAQTIYNQAQTNNWPSASSNAPTATLTGWLPSPGSLIGGAVGSAALGPFGTLIGQGAGGAAGGAISDLSGLTKVLGLMGDYGSHKNPQALQTTGFLNSVDTILNPSITLFNPWNAITMFLARGGLVVIGFTLLIGGFAMMAFGTKAGKAAIGDAVKGAAFA